MKRKDFLKGTGALVGGLAVMRDLKAADFGCLLRDAAGQGDDFFWEVIRDQFPFFDNTLNFQAQRALILDFPAKNIPG